MNVSKKRKNMFILEEYLYSLKMKFNNSVKRLRLEKEDLIDTISQHNIRITKINSELGVEEKLFTPEIDLELEYPEKFYEISEEDMTEFRAKKEREANKGYGGANEENVEEEDGHKKKKAKKEVTTMGNMVPKQRRHLKVQASELMEEMKKANEVRLLTEKKQLLKE